MIDESFAVAEQDVRDALLLRDLPHALLVVEVGSVLGKPEDLDVLPNLRVIRERHRLLRGVNPAVVQGKNDAPSCRPSSNHQTTDEEDELGAILASLGHARDERAVLSRGIVDRSESGNLAVLARRRNGHLLAPAHPRSRQVGVKMEVGFIFEPELKSRIPPESPFFWGVKMLLGRPHLPRILSTFERMLRPTIDEAPGF